MILVTGAPHSGTGYMALLFQAFGFDVGHEEMGADGVSCWAWAVDDPYPPWSPGKRPDLKGWTVYHVIRDPHFCVPAIAQDAVAGLWPETRAFMERHIELPDHPLVYGAAVYEHMNAAAAEIADHTIHLEHAPERLAEILDLDMPCVLPPTTANTRAGGNRKPLHPEVLEAIMREVTVAV